MVIFKKKVMVLQVKRLLGKFQSIGLLKKSNEF